MDKKINTGSCFSLPFAERLHLLGGGLRHYPLMRERFVKELRWIEKKRNVKT